MISFNSIPLDIRTPGHFIEFDATRAAQGLPVKRQRALIIGQRSAGSFNSLFQAPSVAQVERSLGRRSIIAGMCRAFKAANTNTDLWVIGLQDDPSGVAATGTLTFSGPATAAGLIRFLVAGQEVPVVVAVGDTAAQLATKFVTAANQNTMLIVTATAAAEVVTLTARFKGETGNVIDVRHSYYEQTLGSSLPAGVGVAVSAMSGGTLNPSIAAALAEVGDEQFDTIVTGVTDNANMTLLETWLADRFGPMVQKEGLAFCGFSGTFSQTTTFGLARNSPYVVAVATSKSPSPPWEWAAQVAALDAGEPDPARPRQTLVLPTMLPPTNFSTWGREERNTLLYDGMSTTKKTPGGQMQIERLVTMYRLDAFGNPDTSYLDVETLRTIMYLRYSLRLRIAQKYPRHKLANDGTLYGPGQAIVTPSVIRSEMLALFREWEYAGLVENFEQFKKDLIVERPSTDPNRIDAVIPPDCVNQFRVFAGQVQFRV